MKKAVEQSEMESSSNKSGEKEGEVQIRKI